MPTTTEIAAAATQFVTASNKAHSIVNGPASGAGSLISVESGDLKTHARQQAEFEAAGASALDGFDTAATAALSDLEAATAALSGTLLDAILAVLGLTKYANLSVANAALAIGEPFFNQDTNKVAITTA